jgi:hypothetical protein
MNNVIEATILKGKYKGENVLIPQILKKFVTQSKTGLQIYEGHDDQFNRQGPMA